VKIAIDYSQNDSSIHHQSCSPFFFLSFITNLLQTEAVLQNASFGETVTNTPLLAYYDRPVLSCLPLLAPTSSNIQSCLWICSQSTQPNQSVPGWVQ